MTLSTPTAAAEVRMAGDIARRIRVLLNDLEAALVLARAQGQVATIADLEARRAFGIRAERWFATHAGSPAVDFEPTPCGDPARLGFSGRYAQAREDQAA